MLAMIKFNIKASNSWEAFHRTRLGICMADRTHRARLILELSDVTSGTWQVIYFSGKL